MDNRNIGLLILFLGNILVGFGAIIYGINRMHAYFFYSSLIQTSVDEIYRNPSFWVNKSVLVEGKLVGPMASTCMHAWTYSYSLFGLNETIETLQEKRIAREGPVAIEVKWKSDNSQYHFEQVKVAGMVRKSSRFSLGNRNFNYYLEAQEIRRFPAAEPSVSKPLD